MRQQARTLFVMGLLGLVAACAPENSAEPPPHRVLDGDLDALRTAFDGDAGKVRAIFLASPT